jgi:hypothetical protein
VPAAAVIRVPRALSGIIGRKGCVGGFASRLLKPGAQLQNRNRNGKARVCEGYAELYV